MQKEQAMAGFSSFFVNTTEINEMLNETYIVNGENVTIKQSLGV